MKQPSDIKRKELYYNILTDKMYEFRYLVEELKVDIIKSMGDSFDTVDYQKGVILNLVELIKKEEIDTLRTQFQNLSRIRGDVLSGFARRRIDQVLSSNPEYRPEYFLETRVKSSSNAVYTKETQIGHYFSEPEIDEEVKSRPENYIDTYALDGKSMSLISARNIVKFFSSKYIKLDTKKPLLPRCQLMFRIKNGPRDMEKIVDWILQVDREEFHYDSIATFSIVPENSFYDHVKMIKNLSDEDMHFDVLVNYFFLKNCLRSPTIMHTT